MEITGKQRLKPGEEQKKDYPRRRLMPNEMVHPTSPNTAKNPYFLCTRKNKITTITVLGVSPRESTLIRMSTVATDIIVNQEWLVRALVSIYVSAIGSTLQNQESVHEWLPKK
jgi:hypothetical protein